MYKETASLRLTTIIVGLHSLMEAVWFYNLVNFAPENIPVTKELKLSFRSANAVYLLRLEEERVEQAIKKEKKGERKIGS